MAWQRTIVDLSGKDVSHSQKFVERVMGFKVDHLDSIVSYTLPVSHGGIRTREITISQFFDHTDNSFMELDFGSPNDTITIFSTYRRGPANFYLFELLGIEHEMGVLDAYACAYGGPLHGYNPRGY